MLVVSKFSDDYGQFCINISIPINNMTVDVKNEMPSLESSIFIKLNEFIAFGVKTTIKNTSIRRTQLLIKYNFKRTSTICKSLRSIQKTKIF